MENINIETAYNVLIDYKPAGVGYRLLAYLLDALFKFLVFWGIFIIAILISKEISYSIFGIIIFIVIFASDPILEYFLNGQTFGKMILKIKVVKLDGSPAGISAYLLRWILGFIDFAFSLGACALISIIITRHSQRLGDIAAGTTVVSLSGEAQINSTMFEELNSNYRSVYPNVVKLTETDISVVKELLRLNSMLNKPGNLSEAMISAKHKIMNKISVDSAPDTVQFLKTILMDYNNEFGKS